MPVALNDPLGASFVKTGSAALLRLQLRQPLQGVLAQLSEKISVGAHLTELQQCQRVRLDSCQLSLPIDSGRVKWRMISLTH